MKDLFWEGFHDEVVKLSFQRAFDREIVNISDGMEKEAILPFLAPIPLLLGTLGIGAAATAVGLSGVGKPKDVPRSRWFSGGDVGKTFKHFGALGATLAGAGAFGGARLLAAGGVGARSALTAARQAFRPAAFGRAGFSPAARKLTQTLAGRPRVGRWGRIGGGIAGEVGIEGAMRIPQMGRRAPHPTIGRPRRVTGLGGF